MTDRKREPLPEDYRFGDAARVRLSPGFRIDRDCSDETPRPPARPLKQTCTDWGILEEWEHQ